MHYKKSFTCVLLCTPDKRNFFTYKKHLKHILEYVKTFKAEVFLTKATNLHILELEELVQSLCDSSKNQNGIEYEIVEKLFPKHTKENQSKEKQEKFSSKVYDYIIKEFRESKVVCLSKIKSKFKDTGLSDSSFSNYLRKARLQIAKDGYYVFKVGIGKYKADQI